MNILNCTSCLVSGWTVASIRRLSEINIVDRLSERCISNRLSRRGGGGVQYTVSSKSWRYTTLTKIDQASREATPSNCKFLFLCASQGRWEKTHRVAQRRDRETNFIGYTYKRRVPKNRGQLAGDIFGASLPEDRPAPPRGGIP